MKARNTGIRIMVFALALMLAAMSAEGSLGVKAAREVASELAVGGMEQSYGSLPQQYTDVSVAAKEQILPVQQAQFDGEGDLESFAPEGTEATGVLLQEDQRLVWSVSVPEDVVYHLQITYAIPVDSAKDAFVGVYVDGKLPFLEASSFMLRRTWRMTGEEAIDIYGNQMPQQVESVARWTEEWLTDAKNTSLEPLRLYLPAGNHTLALVAAEGNVAIASLKLGAYASPQSYSAVLEAQQVAHPEATFHTDCVRTVEAEKPLYQNDKMIAQIHNSSNAYLTPYHPSLTRYNTLGSDRWATIGQAVTWELDVPEAGFYRIGLTYLQSVKSDSASCRRLEIDGTVPFAEVAKLEFPYSSDWKSVVLGEENGTGGYWFYLSAGKHTLTLTADVGKLQDALRELEDCLDSLRDINLQFVAVMGSSPDVYRDYRLDEVMPEVLEDMARLSGELDGVAAQIADVLGRDNGQSLSMIRRLSKLLLHLSERSSNVAKSLSDFQSQITNLYAYINDEREQPLELDTLCLLGETQRPKSMKEDFFVALKRQVQQFINSFVYDYASVGTLTEENVRDITVWSTMGRDQSQIIKQLINTRFTPDKKITVRLQLVSATTLPSAILAGIAPDVQLQVGQTDPLNYAFRGAVYNLKNFSDCNEVSARFHHSALEPFIYQDQLYALPDTQSFYMLFYRKDILERLGIHLSQLETWDSILQDVLPILQNSSLEFGLPYSYISYTMMLYQKGGSLYDAAGEKVLFTEDTATTAMMDYADLYTDYGLQLAYDLSNRFRSGEMPLAVADFTTYNQLSVFAPELQNLWSMCTVPGTLKPDGTVDITTPSIVTGTVLLEQSKDKEAAWEFMKWWSDADTVSAYANELEGIMGTAARYAAANTEALEAIAWKREIAEEMQKQWAWVRAIPEVPGGYYMPRYLSFALNEIVVSRQDIIETLEDYEAEVNTELLNKRQEFGLS